MRTLKRYLHNKRGETLIEIVLSVALFALTMLMLSTMFFSALNVSKRNFDTEKKLDKLLDAAAKGEASSDDNTVNVTFTLNPSRTVEQQIVLQKTKLSDTGAVYQFRTR